LSDGFPALKNNDVTGIPGPKAETDHGKEAINIFSMFTCALQSSYKRLLLIP
jgi:hypothetical protein